MSAYDYIENSLVAIFGDKEWWTDESKVNFTAKVERLVEAGYSEEEAVGFIKDVYYTIAREVETRRLVKKAKGR